MTDQERLSQLGKLISFYEECAKETNCVEVTIAAIQEVAWSIELLKALKKENYFLRNSAEVNLKIAMNEQAENKELKTRIYELESENEKYREKLDRMLIERSAIESKLGQALHELGYYKLNQKGMD